MAAAVCATLGPINSLLDKLLSGEYEPEFTDLRHVLEGIKQHMLKSSTPGVVRIPLVRIWMGLLRERAYDIEDWIDGRSSDGRWLQLKWWCSRLARIREFNDRIRYILDCGVTYGVLGPVELAEIRSYGGGGLPIDELADDELVVRAGSDPDNYCYSIRQPHLLVGMDKPEISKITVERLMDDEQELKAVTILGNEGLGKTTLAMELLRKHQSQFDCTAFVCVGPRPSVHDTLMDIARQVMAADLAPASDEQQIAIKLREFLHTRRYLIVIDDIRSALDWTRIKCALPYNDLGSRVLATTEIEYVAKRCFIKPSDDSRHLLKPLDDTDSRTLMLSLIPPPDQEEDCLLDPEILQSLLKMCGGNPLALGVAAGLLAAKGAVISKPAMLESAMSIVNQDCLLQGVRKILYVCYADLPLHVKSCFLYLSAFPKYCTIGKRRLIRRWIAEGFITTRSEESLWEKGERCFNELASRRLIQLVFDDSDDDRPVGCTVKDVIHDFILVLSSEENLVTLGAEMKPESYPRQTVRRLSPDTDTFASTTVYMSSVRSLTLFGNTKKRMPHFSSLKLLRVLDLEDIENLGYNQLKSIGNLSLLRYLGLRGTGVTKLPKKIMMLKHLETLDLRRTMVTQLPTFRSVKLVSLLVDRLQLQRGTGKMQCLEELSMVIVTPISPIEEVSKSHGHGSDSLADLAQLVNKSKKLRMLAARFDHLFGCAETYRQVGVIHFLDEVATSGIQSLILHDYPCNLVDLLVDRWSCTKPDHLRKFELRINGHLSKIPQKIASLAYLTHLHIKVYELEAESLHILGKLPNLVLLNLISELGTPERCAITKHWFQRLKMFSYNCRHHGMGLLFEPRAMPQLQSLQISFGPVQTKSDYGDVSFGIQYLSHLARVHATINCWRATALEVEAAEAAITQQVSLIPNSPVLQLSREEGYELVG